MSVPTKLEFEKISEKKSAYDYYAEKIMRKFFFKTIRETGEILIYRNGVYKPYAKSIIEEECQKIMQDCSTNKCNEVINVIRRSTYTDRERFDNDKNLINLRNKIVNVRTGQVLPPTPTILFRTQLPVSYDSSKEPVKFLKFMEECHPDPVNRTRAIEAFASTLIPTLKLEKMFMNVGEGSNGKSTYFGVIEKVLGGENISNVSIHDLAADKFSKSGLDGKLANIYPDILTKEISDTGALKSLTSGDSIYVQKKGEDAFKMRNFAKLFFSCNELPELGEDSYAVYRRLVLIQWNQQFKSSAEADEEQTQKRNPNLLDELTTDDELSGILNLLIQEARKIISQEGLSHEEKSSDLRKTWAEKSEPIEKFLDEFIEQDFAAKTSKAMIYAEFKKWCKDHKITPRSEKIFNQRISQQLGASSGSARLEENEGKPTKVWFGIKLISDVTAVTDVTT